MTHVKRVGGPTVTGLPPRHRDVLVHRMNGDSEKQAALELGLSHHTVHDYVKVLQVRLGASSRGELLTRCRALWPDFDQHTAKFIGRPKPVLRTPETCKRRKTGRQGQRPGGDV